MAKRTLDLRGLSCPQPVFETKKAVEGPSFDEIEVIVDTKTSVENIKTLLDSKQSLKYTVQEGEDFTITISHS